MGKLNNWQSKRNVLCFFSITMSIYSSQGLFFVATASYFSQMKEPLIPLGNVFLLAMIPFVITVFFLASKIDAISTNRQLHMIKISRTLILVVLSVGILLKFEPSILIYLTILVYDLSFFLYQSTSSRMSKHIAQSNSLKYTESINLLGIQFGMAFGGLLAGFLLKPLTLSGVFFLAAILEGVGLIGVFLYKEALVSKRELASSITQKHPGICTFKVIKTYVKSPVIILSLLTYALLLPFQQTFNLVSGPWSEWRFADHGQMLGWLVGGIAVGACVSSICLMLFTKMRDLEWLRISPMVSCLSVLGVYYSHNLPYLLFFSVMFGFSFTAARVIIRSDLISKVSIESVNSATMVATMLSVVLAILAIAFVSYVSHLNYFQIFLLVSIIGFVQCLLLVFEKKIMGWLSLIPTNN